MTDYQLADGRLFRRTVEGRTSKAWGGDTLDARHEVWRQVYLDGTSRSIVNPTILERDGRTLLQFADESEVEIINAS